jgi:hypothetical protein
MSEKSSWRQTVGSIRPLGHQHRHAQIRTAHHSQDVLFKMPGFPFADPEAAPAAIARQYPLRVPARSELPTHPTQFFHQRRAPRIIAHARGIRPELRDQALRPILPVQQEELRPRLQEHVPQQIRCVAL